MIGILENGQIFAVNVIHVKDEVCPMPTGIISKLLKQSNGATIAIQNLFVPEADDPSVEQWTQCVICQERSVSIALLPCRHACICFDCFIQIDKCPLCRSYISTYFVLKPAQAQSDLANQSQSSTVDSPQSQSSTESPRRGLLARVNHQFNRLFSL